MSVHITKAVYDEAPLTNPLYLSVAAALAFYANDSGVAWPSVASLAKRCRCSERTVRNALSAMVEVGMLAIEHRPGKASRYTLTPAGGAGRPLEQGGTSCRPPLQEVQDTPAGDAVNRQRKTSERQRVADAANPNLQRTPADVAAGDQYLAAMRQEWRR